MDRRLHQTFLTGLRVFAFAALVAAAPGAWTATVSERLQHLIDSTIGQEQEYLHPDEAFRFRASAVGANVVLASWDIADGYYLYRDKFSFAVTDGAAAVDQAALQLPPGQIREDEVFGRVLVNTGRTEILVPMLREPGPELPVTLNVGYQGCKDKSICYPPIERGAEIVLAVGTGSAPAAAAPPRGDSAVDRLGQTGFMANVLAFLGFGLLLSLTPCVFPMIPILSGILIGSGKTVTPMRGLMLSGAYVLAMAVTYAVFGVIAGSFQINLQAASQAPWVITAFSGVFVVLALSMFGLFELQIPAAIQARLGTVGSAPGEHGIRAAASMGALSALIVGPCVAPPLAAALLYISQTGDAALGGAALFSMGLGFGVPLLLIGASAGGLLPRAGPWMKQVRRLFGFLMLGVAVWFLGRILPGQVTLTLWALLFMVSAMYMGALDPLPGDMPWQRLSKGLGLAMLVYGVLLMVGAVSGADDALRPLERLARPVQNSDFPRPLEFRTIASLDELNVQLQRAASAGKPVMLDFYADWCVTCKEMERNTFPDARVREMLKHAVLVQADVTHYDAAARKLLESFDLIGPPAILFFDSNARERAEYRLLGFVAPERFAAHLRAALGS